MYLVLFLYKWEVIVGFFLPIIHWQFILIHNSMSKYVWLGIHILRSRLGLYNLQRCRTPVSFCTVVYPVGLQPGKDFPFLASFVARSDWLSYANSAQSCNCCMLCGPSPDGVSGRRDRWGGSRGAKERWMKETWTGLFRWHKTSQ